MSSDQTPAEPNYNPSGTRFYYVDEAGDATLFDRRGRDLVGTAGCSRYFILGKLDVLNPVSLASDLVELRERLLSDPYFRGVPSMQVEQRKTAIALHAKDDLPEVRREVFQVLLRHDVFFYAVVRDKSVIHQKVRDENQRNPRYRYHPNQLYDRCVSALFQVRLHKDAGYSIYFARRGGSDRTEALERALQAARDDFRKRGGVASSAPIEIIPCHSADVACLQAADYFHWALQRLFERNEGRFLELLWPKVMSIVDTDDTRESPDGLVYSQSNPLTSFARAKK